MERQELDLLTEKRRWARLPVTALLFSLLFFLICFGIGMRQAGAAEEAVLQTGRPDLILLSWRKDPLTTQTVSWQGTAGPGRERIQYLPAADFAGSFAGARELPAEENELLDGSRRWEVTLEGLNPDTPYVYRVGRQGAWSEPAFFTTAGEGLEFSFLYMGDVQEGYESWGKMLERALAEKPELKFILSGGDLVDEGNSMEEWLRFFAAGSSVFRRLPLMPTVGNHDDSQLFRQFFALPGNGPEGHGETIYSFDYGNCHFTVLNSNWMGRPDSGDYDRISRWLREDLRQSRQLWKIVVFHHPPYPVAPDWRAEVLQEHWVPILEENGVDLVFVGHQHLYMRTKPLKDGRIQPEGEGIVYLMGNAGTKHYSFQSAADYVAVLLTRVQNYQIVELRGNSLTVTSKDWQGNVVDNFRLVKEAGGGNLSTGRWIRLVVCLIQLLRGAVPLSPGGMN
jgi:hypothetical protein